MEKMKLDELFEVLKVNSLSPSYHNLPKQKVARMLKSSIRLKFRECPSWDIVACSLSDVEWFQNLDLENKKKVVIELLEYIGELAEPEED